MLIMPLRVGGSYCRAAKGRRQKEGAKRVWQFFVSLGLAGAKKLTKNGETRMALS
jgi:hypothetical protein